MILSDRSIKLLEEVIDPFHIESVQPASYDIHLSGEFIINGMIQSLFEYVLEPGEFLLTSTIEYIRLPDYLVAQVDGKSSLGRLGLQIHQTAGFIDPGYEGVITLELYNAGDEPIRLVRGMGICQLVFMRMDSPAEFPYGSECLNSHYQGSDSVVGSYLKW